MCSVTQMIHGAAPGKWWQWRECTLNAFIDPIPSEEMQSFPDTNFLPRRRSRICWSLLVIVCGVFFFLIIMIVKKSLCALKFILQESKCHECIGEIFSFTGSCVCLIKESLSFAGSLTCDEAVVMATIHFLWVVIMTEQHLLNYQDLKL